MRDSLQVINETIFTERQRKGEKKMEIHYAGKDSLWIPDLFISNMRTLTNTGFLDHPGIKIDVTADKTLYYSRYAQVVC